MKLVELKVLLQTHNSFQFRIALPGGDVVPLSFHVTEVGRIDKTFYDCGGKLRQVTTCQLQIWVGDDDEHRIETRKMEAILAKSSSIIPDDSVAVEIEYEDEVISQYTIAGHQVVDEMIVLQLANKHTECLAPELCCLPSVSRLPAIAGTIACCPPGKC